jgi:hypothetical protein
MGGTISRLPGQYIDVRELTLSTNLEPVNAGADVLDGRWLDASRLAENHR